MELKGIELKGTPARARVRTLTLVVSLFGSIPKSEHGKFTCSRSVHHCSSALEPVLVAPRPIELRGVDPSSIELRGIELSGLEARSSAPRSTLFRFDVAALVLENLLEGDGLERQVHEIPCRQVRRPIRCMVPPTVRTRPDK